MKILTPIVAIKDDDSSLITFDDGAYDFEKFEVLDSSKIHLLQC